MFFFLIESALQP